MQIKRNILYQFLLRNSLPKENSRHPNVPTADTHKLC